ncbi:MAG: cupin domain-containing protein [Fusobacteriaceae bacterium]|jgi:quercetin dioxygenase-like cupin family protein|nr:cupin domain-containing protein [Fusobacteriaceae bacterium]
MHTKNSEIIIEQVSTGIKRKILSHSEKLMLVELSMANGAQGSKHSHPHEQITYVVSGKVSFYEEGKPDSILIAGDSYYITPNSVHGLIALEDSKILDIFTPAREDFLKK